MKQKVTNFHFIHYYLPLPDCSFYFVPLRLTNFYFNFKFNFV